MAHNEQSKEFDHEGLATRPTDSQQTHDNTASTPPIQPAARVTLSDIDHTHYLALALEQARQSPPKPTNFCVGACLVSPGTSREPLVTGYTLECPGNTHAEQSCFIKLARRYNCLEGALGEHLPVDTLLYTTMEPCGMRSVGNTPCVERILGLKRQDGTQAIRLVVVGVLEPETFVGVNEGRKKLESNGLQVVHVRGLEDQILEVATAGHDKRGSEEG